MSQSRIRHRRHLSPQRVVAILLIGVGCATSFAAKNSLRATIQVCQNKDCCQRFQGKAFSLVETMEYLSSGTSSSSTEVPRVESSGCLSQCGKGPNLQVSFDNAMIPEKLFHQVDSVHSAAAILELAIPGIKIHPTLVAAIKVLERAERAATLDETEKCLDSVISALDRKPELTVGPVMAHALVVRAQMRLEQGVPRKARRDATQATELNPSHAIAWRVLADTYEATGDTQAALLSLSRWGEMNPVFRTKAAKEIQRLQEVSQERGSDRR